MKKSYHMIKNHIIWLIYQSHLSIKQVLVRYYKTRFSLASLTVKIRLCIHSSSYLSNPNINEPWKFVRTAFCVLKPVFNYLKYLHLLQHQWLSLKELASICNQLQDLNTISHNLTQDHPLYLHEATSAIHLYSWFKHSNLKK